MRLYTALARDDRLRLIPDGASFFATLFGPLWLAARGAWLAAFATAIIELLLGRAAAADLFWPWPQALLAGVVAAIGLFAHDLRRLELHAAGWRDAGIVAGRGADHAFLRFHDRRPYEGQAYEGQAYEGRAP